MKGLDWMQCLQRALNYMEAHLLDPELDNERVAQQAFAASANFQRIFGIVTGVTVADYIRYRRLTLAGEELAQTQAKVIDVAMKYGYDTPESFTKAFVRFHGQPPSRARHSALGLKHFSPILLRIEIEGGFHMGTKLIANLPPLSNSWFGENYHFSGAVRYLMGCLGEMKLADYELIAGLTGDIFTQFYALGNLRDDSASDFYLGLRGLPQILERLGYAATAFSLQEFQAESAHYRRQIVSSIDKGIPVIWYHGATKGVIVGYEQDGDTLFYLQNEQTEPARLTMDNGFFLEDSAARHGWILVGERQHDVSLKQLYRDAILQLPGLLTTRTKDYVFGAGAFRAWADDIERGKYDGMDPEAFAGNFLAYEVYVANLATNSGGCQSFLEKAQELNPDLTFLADVRRQYRITNYLWNGGYWVKDVLAPEERAALARQYGDATLESLGGAFGCQLKTLQDKERRTPIVRQLRRCADCLDEVVRLLTEGLKQATPV